MQFPIKTSAGIALMPADSQLLTHRKIFIEGEISAETACSFLKQVLFLNREDAHQPIDVMVNSCGGEINSGLLMYDVIQSSTAPIRMYCAGKAYSMAAILIACGMHGRYILPHGELMLHQPLLGNQVGGNASSLKSISDSLLETKAKINAILSKHTGKNVEEIEQMTSFDHYFTAEEAVDAGLCDEICSFEHMI